MASGRQNQGPADRAAPRFFVDAPLQGGALTDLPERVLRHIQVLRLHENDEITLFDGRGGEYPAILQALARHGATARVLAHQAIERESPVAITLAQGISAGDRMDFTLQKATELGVSRIVPLACERSVVKLTPERAARRIEHWRQVIASACEQCGRNRLPELAAPTDLHPWLMQGQSGGAGCRLMLDPRATASLAGSLGHQPGPVTLLIGPEGGLTGPESSAALARGFTGVRLGPRILRTETAPLAALVIVQALAGDFQ